mmetsp:Transcript_65930/g.169687  ORF Transcript_65930/g.169687 Transcript_65930/m.169687 type:complete len:260 (+) Transcript_65930:1184-1963(+)
MLAQLVGAVAEDEPGGGRPVAPVATQVARALVHSAPALGIHGQTEVHEAEARRRAGAGLHQNVARRDVAVVDPGGEAVQRRCQLHEQLAGKAAGVRDAGGDTALAGLCAAARRLEVFLEGLAGQARHGEAHLPALMAHRHGLRGHERGDLPGGIFLVVRRAQLLAHDVQKLHLQRNALQFGRAVAVDLLDGHSRAAVGLGSPDDAEAALSQGLRDAEAQAPDANPGTGPQRYIGLRLHIGHHAHGGGRLARGRAGRRGV